MKLKLGSKNVDVKIGDKRVNAFLGSNSTKEPITVSVNITLGGPEGAPGWIGLMYTTGELPKTKAEMRSLYNYSGSGSNYTVNREDLTPIPLKNSELYAEVTNTSFKFDVTVAPKEGEKTLKFIMFNDWNVKSDKFYSGFATFEVKVPLNRKLSGKTVNCKDIHFVWSKENINNYEKSIKESDIVEPFKYNRVQLAYNYCTLSYTMALWGEKEWEEELKKLKNAGFTHVLVNAGLEKVWYDYLISEGFSQEDAISFIPDSTHRAWWLMGNLEGERGPLSMQQIERQAEIGRFICNFCWENGMIPVLNAFTGVVPLCWNKYFPNEPTIPAGANWCGYTRPTQLDPTDNYYNWASKSFKDHAKKYHKCLFDVFGITEDKPVDFSGDPFHEGFSPRFPSGLSATKCAYCFQEVQQEARKGSIWFLQHWQENPTQELLNGCNPQFTVVQKLCKDLSDKTPNTSGYSSNGNTPGQIPWIWAIVNSFGDRPGFYGDLEVVKAGREILNSKINNCIGWGFLDEGMSYNPEYYQYMFNILSGVDRPKFLGSPWINLKRSCYNVTRLQEGPSESTITAEPYFGINNNRASAWGSGGFYHNKEEVILAANTLLKELKADNSKYEDLTWRDFFINVLRQVIADKFDKSNVDFSLFDKMESILNCSQKWNLHYYWEMAKRKATYNNVVNQSEAEHFYRSWICLLTCWKSNDTNNSSRLFDYSMRHIGGMMVDFYKKRWEMYKSGKTQSEIRLFSQQYHQTCNIPEKPNILPVSEFISLAESIFN